MYTLTDVTKTYTQSKRKVTALDNVSLEIPDGQLVAIQGPTGGGKSTLLQMLGALDRPTSGTVQLESSSLSSLRDGKLTVIRATEIGFVFQGFNLIPTLTAQENVETALAPLKVSRGGAQAARPPRLSHPSAWAIAAPTCRLSSPVVSSSAWPSLARSSRIRMCCSRTNRRATSTRRPVTRSWTSSRGCGATAGSP